LTACIVDKDVDSAETLERAVDYAGDLVVVADVGGHAEGSRPECLDLRGRPLQRLLAPAADDHVGAAAGEVERDGSADTGAATRDQSD